MTLPFKYFLYSACMPLSRSFHYTGIFDFIKTLKRLAIIRTSKREMRSEHRSSNNDTKYFLWAHKAILDITGSFCLSFSF